MSGKGICDVKEPVEKFILVVLYTVKAIITKHILVA